MVTVEDVIAIHRAHQQAGDDTALVEVRRRWPGLADHVYLELIRRVMRLKVEVPTITDRAPPSPGVAPDDDKVRRDAERKRVRQRERDDARRERMKAKPE